MEKIKSICVEQKPVFFMMVGLPGSGKSVQAQYISKRFSANIHSSDSIREELFGDPRIQDNHDLVFKILHDRVKEDLHNSKCTIYDATNINYKRRKAFLQELSKIDCWKVCVLMATPYFVCIERNKDRNAVVPESVIKKMLMNFWVPQNYEGWDDIVIMQDCDYPNGNIKDLFNYSSLDYSVGINSIEQDNIHHTLTVGHHCLLTRAIIEQSYPDFPDEVYMAALLHDIGKPFTKTFIDSKGNDSEQAHYYQHHLVGAYMSLHYVPKTYTDAQRLRVANIIQWHMRPFDIEKAPDSNKLNKKFKELVGRDYDAIYAVHYADIKAK